MERAQLQERVRQLEDRRCGLEMRLHEMETVDTASAQDSNAGVHPRPQAQRRRILELETRLAEAEQVGKLLLESKLGVEAELWENRVTRADTNQLAILANDLDVDRNHSRDKCSGKLNRRTGKLPRVRLLAALATLGSLVRYAVAPSSGCSRWRRSRIGASMVFKAISG
eukprot:TRINITY_DN2869_c0_g1_i4.p2 TRINITY_DN2869_c0_g1~~TRINITY_DN2869_c0_g1_i4.p2  ORF type:complete len:169 (+),score=24.29 TRINITY_DN2869_c0_g1_i4:375-881(+)